MDTPNKIIIDLAALARNFSRIREFTGDRSRIMGVVKSDAYGHGLVPVSRILEKNRVDRLGVAFYEEALILRKNHIQIPIIILSGIHNREEIEGVVSNNLTPVLYDPAIAEALNQEALKQVKQVPVHLKVDTGMGRLGLLVTEARHFIKQVSALKGLFIEGLTSHLSSADRYEDAFTREQITRFKGAIDEARNLGVDPPLNSLANSAGLMGHPEAGFSLLRPGISLYGGKPCPDFPVPVPLEPVMHFKARVLQVRTLPGNTPVSYCRTFISRKPLKIAVISAGYADGLMRSLSNKGYVLIRGSKVPIIGTICMNLTVADVTGIQGVIPGDEAVFLGRQGKETITGDEMAATAGTISYEVFCALGSRTQKEYVP